MADDTSTDPAPDAPAKDAAPEQPPADTLGEGGLKALQAEREQRKALEARLKEFEDRDKTEAQRLEERATTAERERDEARTEALRARVAATKAVPADLHDFLTGTTEEALNAQADRLLSRVVTPPPAPPFNGGPRSTPDADGVDMNVLLRAAARGGNPL